MVVIDEAHKFAKVPIIRQQMSVMVRERRHLKLSLLLSCQDPGGLPAELLPLLDMVGADSRRPRASQHGGHTEESVRQGA